VPSAKMRAGPPTDTFVGAGWNVVKHETNNSSTTMKHTSLFGYVYCLQCAGLVSRQRSQVKKQKQSHREEHPLLRKRSKKVTLTAFALGREELGAPFVKSCARTTPEHGTRW
jgi:hypothetical protein